MDRVKQHEIDFAHNSQSAAQAVHATNTFHSWTVVISFYSALHFVRAKIFPLNETIHGKKVTMNSFDSYCLTHQDRTSKHERLIALVGEHLPVIQAQYKWLFDNSVTARYRYFVFDVSFANKALDYLEKIKVVCTAPLKTPKKS